LLLELWLRCQTQRHFAIAGLFGFSTEFLVLHALNVWLHLDLLVSKPTAYLLATAVTWLYNSNITFQKFSAERRLEKFTVYLGVAASAAVINHLIFFAAVQMFHLDTFLIVLPLIFSSGLTMIYSFLLYRYLVFKGPV
jgi:putative flippase GtrA